MPGSDLGGGSEPATWKSRRDAGLVCTPNYTVLKRADWEDLTGLFKRAAGVERINDDLVRRIVQALTQALVTRTGGVGKTMLKMAALPGDRIAEIDDFVDFLRQREERHSLQRDFAALSEPSFAKIWDNSEDSIYDDL